MARDSGGDAVAVIGLGRFGASLALELMTGGETDVLGVDADPDIVQVLAERLTHAVVADSTKAEALRQLGIQEFERVVIGIGGDLEASILTASTVLELGVPQIWAKAVSDPHARILAQLGVHHVVRPEHDMGRRVAHLVRGRMLDYIEFDDGFAMVKTVPPPDALDLRLGDSGLRTRYGVTIVALKRPGAGFTYATADTVLRRGDVVIVSGRVRDVERFN